jgi:hypothetical protein
MAEIRKYDPAAGNAIAQALKAAMGEPVRPNQPGSAPASRPSEATPPVTTSSWLTVKVTPPDSSDED